MALSRTETVENRARLPLWNAAHGRMAEPTPTAQGQGGRFTLEPADAPQRPQAGTSKVAERSQSEPAKPQRTETPATTRAETGPRPGRAERSIAKASATAGSRGAAGEDRTTAPTAQSGDPQVQAGEAGAAAGGGAEAGTASTDTGAPAEAGTAGQAVLSPPPAPVPMPGAAIAGQAAPPDGATEAPDAEAAAADVSGTAKARGPSASPAGASRTAEAGFEAALASARDGRARDGLVSDGLAAEAPSPASVSLAPSPGEARASSAPSAAETGAASASQAAAPASAPVPLGAVPMTIGLRALGAASRFEIRLDPVELGRIDVALDIDKDSGTVGARLVVDRPETLALLQRDASSLQQALAQTGLDASAGIALSLRDSGEGRRESGSERGGQPRATGRDDAPDTQTTINPIGLDAAPLRALRGYGGLDIRI